ncbi:collagen alpha-1(I) chain-like [Clupea harengus]|uniref:Collagen alpha-1(I) chain-like n=1 Tax=Clupea harengus TaxID=7950 RepID=A0A6P8F1H4_CLUHA|nr:collagen alpha-1(I) chain-like [Clupea harengus]
MFTLAYTALLVSASLLLVHGGVISKTRICEDDGKTYHDQERWQPNPCTSCMCENGNTKCTLTLCAPLRNCPYLGVVPKDQCCPVCPEMEFYPEVIVPQPRNIQQSGRRPWW